MNISIRYILSAILLVLFQGLVCKHIFLGTGSDTWLDVVIYPLAILILPVNTPAALVVSLSFFVGIGVDFFYDSPGVHTAALVLMGFLRAIFLEVLAPRTGYAVDDTPLRIRPTDYWYYSYAGILLLIHIFVYYLVLYFSLTFLLTILLKTILTFLLSMLLISIHAILWRTFNL